MLRFSILTALSLSVFSQALWASDLDQVLDSSGKKVAEAAKSQKKIDKVADQTQTLFDEYKETEKLVEDLKIYNKKLQVQVDSQIQRLEEIEQSISQVQVMQRQMLPLIERMIEQLEQFIALDLPFLLEEREERVAFLKNSLARSDLSTAEKFRQLLEAWKIEHEYGRKIEAYKSTIELAGNSIEVEMLRLGRIALIYQTLDGSQTGAWDKTTQSWQALDSSFAKTTRQAIKMANKQANVDVMTIPTPALEPLSSLNSGVSQ